MWFVLWIILAVLAITGIIVAMVLAEKKRRRLLAAWAAKHGFSQYEADVEKSWLKNFQAWGPGYGHKCFDGYEGEFGGYPIRTFQHQSRTKTKDSETIHNFTVCVIEAPIKSPGLTIKRENLFHKVFDALGGEDIDFESDEFSKKFWVKANKRKFAYDVIHPRMMEFLLTAPKLHWEWRGNRLVLFVAGSFNPSRAQPLLDNGTKFLELLPSHLTQS